MTLRQNYELAGIAYSGMPGITKECRDAVMRLVQYGDCITKAFILSCGQEHGFLLKMSSDQLIAVKSGFRSGYSGEGSRGFSYILKVLQAHGAEIDEYAVSPKVLRRLDQSALTKNDLRMLKTALPVRPSRCARVYRCSRLEWQHRWNSVAGVSASYTFRHYRRSPDRHCPIFLGSPRRVASDRIPPVGEYSSRTNRFK